ncbi:hypothetical protein [Chitinophaga rhizophila]|uniref:DKNYY family protein n=1 Tax=Chitinophaga rhizophila TaxID=2866212 RepID=A0ABS7GBJ9_9BACT|nr:hypothetical protein [Chitinophaga rhizophila]MBW8684500.1 hypothetical protein [Chitinophaga rhizophila]
MRIRLRYCLLLLISLPALAQKPKVGLSLTSSKQHQISVYKGTIIVNGNKTFTFKQDSINYASKRNRVEEDKGSVFLFLDVKDGPKKNKLYVFSINNSIADSVLTTISSDIKDWDHDGLLEFGGSEAGELYPSADSMYYVPAKFYEIKKGKLVYDAEYTEKIDTKVNGVFIANPLENNGKYKVIPKKRRS